MSLEDVLRAARSLNSGPSIRAGVREALRLHGLSSRNPYHDKPSDWAGEFRATDPARIPSVRDQSRREIDQLGALGGVAGAGALTFPWFMTGLVKHPYEISKRWPSLEPSDLSRRNQGRASSDLLRYGVDAVGALGEGMDAATRRVPGGGLAVDLMDASLREAQSAGVPTPLQVGAEMLTPGFGEAALFKSIIPAFVGSPNKWHKKPGSRFGPDMDAIGTGEGAQAQGHGLYSAQRRAVAEEYARTNTAADFEWAAKNPELAGKFQYAMAVEDARIGSPTGTGMLSPGDPEFVDALERIRAGDSVPGVSDELALQVRESWRGLERQNVYGLIHDVNPEDLLDLDRPLSEQSQKVRDLVRPGSELFSIAQPMLAPGRTGSGWHKLDDEGRSLVGSRYTGSQLYSDLSDALGPEGASRALADAGIPGTRYLDQGSRNQQTRVKALRRDAKGFESRVRDGSGDMIDPDTRSAEADRYKRSLRADPIHQPRKQWDGPKTYQEQLDETLDAISEAVSDQTHNYVMFTDELSYIDPSRTEPSLLEGMGPVGAPHRTTGPGGGPTPDPQEFVYHVTATENVPGIESEGIMPMHPSNWVKKGDRSRYGEGEVFAFDDLEDAMRWAAKMDWDFNQASGTGKISIVRARKSGPDWEPDIGDPRVGPSAVKRFSGIGPEDIDSAVPLDTDMTRSLVVSGPAAETARIRDPFPTPRAAEVTTPPHVLDTVSQSDLIVDLSERQLQAIIDPHENAIAAMRAAEGVAVSVKRFQNGTGARASSGDTSIQVEFNRLRNEVDAEIFGTVPDRRLSESDQISAMVDLYAETLSDLNLSGKHRLSIPEDSNLLEQQAFTAAQRDPRFASGPSNLLRLQSSGKTIDAPQDIDRIKPGQVPSFVSAYHGTTVGARYSPQAVISEGGVFHVGTHRAAEERVGLRPGSLPLGVLAGREAPTVHELVVDSSRIYKLGNPVDETGAVGLESVLSRKDQLRADGFSGVAYINRGEDSGSVSFAIWDDSAIRPTPRAATGSARERALATNRSARFDVDARTWSDGEFEPIGDNTNSRHLRDTETQIPTLSELETGLNQNQRTKLWANRDIEPGDAKLRPGGSVKLRIDIPFFNRTGQYAVTVHGAGKGVGKVVGYDSIVRLDGDVRFSSNERVAEKILRGGDSKTPIATVEGKLTQNREIPSDIDDWTAVGYNPHKSTYFYDKVTGQEVLSGTDAISVGNSVYVRKPKYGKRQMAAGSRAAEGVATGPRLASDFSGLRTMEAAFAGKHKSIHAAEIDPEVSAEANKSHGTEFAPQSVYDVDPKQIADADLYHASPVCKSLSRANLNRKVLQSDIDSAQKIASNILEARPRTVSVENVPEFATKPELIDPILDALTEAGYRWDVQIHDAADYGAAMHRNRMVIRGVREGELPELPSRQAPGDWYETIRDLIDDAPDAPFGKPKKKRMAEGKGQWEQDRIAEMVERGELDPGMPIITMGGSTNKKLAYARNAGGPAPTLKATHKEKARIILPDGRVKELTPRMMARLMGLPDSFRVPDAMGLAKKTIGNGIHGATTRGFIEPLANAGAAMRGN